MTWAGQYHSCALACTHDTRGTHTQHPPTQTGKSTLLDILAQVKTSGRLAGGVWLNGKPAGGARFRSVTQYVAQEDTFVPTMSAWETLRFYARLRTGECVRARACLRAVWACVCACATWFF